MNRNLQAIIRALGEEKVEEVLHVWGYFAQPQETLEARVQRAINEKGATFTKALSTAAADKMSSFTAEEWKSILEGASTAVTAVNNSALSWAQAIWEKDYKGAQLDQQGRLISATTGQQIMSQSELIAYLSQQKNQPGNDNSAQNNTMLYIGIGLVLVVVVGVVVVGMRRRR